MATRTSVPSISGAARMHHRENWVRPSVSEMPFMPGPSMSGSFHAPMPVPGTPGREGGVPEWTTVWSKLCRMLSKEICPGEQMSPVLRNRLATSGAQFHGPCSPQLHA